MGDIKWMECPLDADMGRLSKYVKAHGHISTELPVLLQEALTLEKAQIKCQEMPECHGLSMEREPASPQEDVMIYFKGAVDLHFSNWTSYIYIERANTRSRKSHAPSNSVLGGIASLFFGSSQKDQPKFLSLRGPRSEPLPMGEAAFTGRVRNIVGTNFANVTQNPAKDVVVNCFAPWCGYCQSFKPLYRELASNLRHVRTLEFTQVDATRNELNDRTVHHFPTLLLYPAGSQKQRVIEFTRPHRTIKDVTDWLVEVATHKFDPTPPNQTSDKGQGGGLLGDEFDL
jgi:thiol-disulfide isomerase/thioredoxin